MNQTFSLNRWLLLMRQRWTECGSLYLYGIVSIIGATAIFMFFWVNSNHIYRQGDLLVVYLFGINIIGAIFASSAFEMLQKKNKGIYFLSLPASHFEKLLTMIVYNVVFFTLIFSICFYGVQWLTTLIVKARVASDPEKYGYVAFHFGRYKWIDEAFFYFGKLYFGIQALFLLGSVYFKRFSFLLTLVIGGVLFFLGIYYLVHLQDLIFPDHYWNTSGLHPRKYTFDTPLPVYKLPETLRRILGWFCLLGWAPLLWWATWYRLREKEI